MRILKTKVKILLFFVIGLITLWTTIFAAQASREKQRFIVGAKNCTEQHLLGEILSELIEKYTDVKVIRRFNLEGTTICFNALKSGTIDAYFEYTGTALFDILKEKKQRPSLYTYLKTTFEKKFGITWLDPLGFANQYILITQSSSPVKNISDLRHYPKLQIAFDPEFIGRYEYKLLKNEYHLARKIQLMDQVLLYFSLLKGGVDVISGCSTDGRLLDEKLTTLIDDKKVLPKYEIAPIVNMKRLEKFPQVKKVFSLLEDTISAEDMIKMNYQVEFEKKDVRIVAKEFIENMTS